MKNLMFNLRAAAAAAILSLTAAASAQTIAITEWMNDTNGDGATAVGAGEWTELYNYGTTAVTMTSWRLKDDDTDNALLPTITIQPKDFAIIARNKANFEKRWFAGVANSRVYQPSSGTFAQSDTGDDELVLYNSSSVVVWRVAYPASTGNSGSSTYYAETDFTITNHGTKTATISRNGADALTSNVLTKGYEGQEFTADPYAISRDGDVGSPLRGNYTGANNPAADPTSWSLDVTGNGIPLSSGVRGLAIADQSLDRHDNSDQSGNVPSVQIARGSSIRGVSGGLNADIYNWETRNAQPRPTTLLFLQYARDYNEELVITANIRGLTEPDPNVSGFRRYYTSDTLTLANLAADWVRYTNRICQMYHLGDTITDSRDQAVLNSLTWNSSYVNEFGTADNFTTLPAVGEAPLKKVKYWEIGNEPLVSLANAYSVTNGFTFSGTAGNSTNADYVNRYIAITQAMLAEDPTIKVGPCIVGARSGSNANILDALLASGAQVDFISYHPYGSMGDWWQLPGAPLWEQAYLGGVYSEQYNFLQDIKAIVATRRPSQVNTMIYMASETNVSDFRTNNTYQEGTMAHALGCAESIFSWGRLGLSIAHYWIWVMANSLYYDDADRYPSTMLWEKMRDAPLGDRLIGSFDANEKVRVHVVRDTTSNTLQVWAMNFSNTTDIPFTLQLTGAGTATNSIVTKTVLGAISGPTNLWNVNLPPEQNFNVARRDIDWSTPVVVAGANPSNMNITLPASTLTLFTIQNFTPTAVQDWALFE